MKRSLAWIIGVVVVSGSLLGVWAGTATADSQVTEVGPGVFSVKNLPIEEDGSESGVAAAKVAEFKEARANAWSEQEVEDSATEHADLGSAGAQVLFTNAFGDQISQVLEDPSETLRNADEIIQFRDDYTAVIDPAGPQDRAIVVSTAPLRTDDNRLPDLDLQSQAGEITVKEPTTEVDFSRDPAEGIDIPQANVGISFDQTEPAAPDASIMTVEGEGNEVAFYPNAYDDTDLIAAPLANGVETFAQLRSEDSPEQITMPVDVPQGGAITATSDGGAVIADGDGKAVAQVYPPVAVDAKGGNVDMSLTITGNDLVLHVPHVGSGYAYPILVDPVVETWNWWTGTNTTAPGWSYTEIGDTDYQGSDYCFTVTIDSCGSPSSGGGLFAYAPPGYQYTQNSQSRWHFYPPGTDSYISQAKITSWRYKKGGASNGNPFAYWGIATGYLWNDYQITDLDSGGNNRTLTGGVGAREFAIGLTTNSTMTLPSGTANWRYNRLGAVEITMTDQTKPTLNPISLTGLNLPTSGWISQSTINQSRSIHASAWDSGLGIKKIFVLGVTDAGTWYSDEWNRGCTGGFQSICDGVTPTGGVDVPVHPSALGDGKKTLSVFASDARDELSTAQTFDLKIDRQAPTVNLSDQLAEATDSEQDQQTADEDIEEVSRTTYQLDISTDDSNGTREVSGVKSIDVYMNQNPGDLSSIPLAQHYDATCATQSCPATFNKTWELDLSGKAVGDYLASVHVTDLAGNTRIRNISFTYNPGTGLKDEYSFQHIPLPDSSTLDINVANGNLVYSKTDVAQYDGDIPVVVDRSYNSQLPIQESSEWGDRWTTNTSSETQLDESTNDETLAYQDGETGSFAPDVPIPDSDEDTEFAPDIQSAVQTNGDEIEITETDSEVTQVFDQETGQLEQLRGNNLSTVSYDYDEDGVLESIDSNNSFDPNSNVSLPVESSDGVVDGIGGTDPVEYEHDGSDRLTSADVDGEVTDYGYDASSLLTDLTLDDGSTVDITYDSDRRVTQIVLSERSKPTKTWTFAYATPVLVNAYTTMTDPASQVTKFLIGRSGRVLTTSRIGSQSMAFSLSGSMYAAAGASLSQPGEYSLTTDASGGNIATVTTLVDGAVVDQWECATTCTSVNHSWVVDRDELASGIATVEVFATRTNGEQKSERFDVNVPTDPALPEAWTPPSLADAIAFREENELDSSSAYVNSIQNNPAYWYNEYGLPLSTSELAELRARDQTAAEAEDILADYPTTHSSTFAGWYVEQGSGDIVVGFTSNATAELNAVKAQFTDPSRVVAFDQAPTKTLAQLTSTEASIFSDIDTAVAPSWLLDAEVDVQLNKVMAIADEYTTTRESTVQSTYGTSVLLDEYEVDLANGFPDVFNNPLAAGSGQIYYYYNAERCTLGFGAKKKKFDDGRGNWHWEYYAMTAAHCASEIVGPDQAGIKVYLKGHRIGTYSTRHAYTPGHPWYPDIAMIHLANQRAVPCSVRAGASGKVRHSVHAVRGPSGVSRGTPAKKSGMATGVQYGNLLRFYARDGYQMGKATNFTDYGDSGGPIYGKYQGSWSGVSAMGIVDAFFTRRKHPDRQMTIFTPIWSAESILGVDTVVSRDAVCRTH